MIKQFLLLLCLAGLFACQSKPDTLFKRIKARHSGITFRNEITESDTFDVLKFEYLYNGGGLGVGDFNQDGLSDVFFAGNMVSSALYLNQGGFKFKDITQAAKVKTKVWCTGVAIADLDANGWPDIYVSTIAPTLGDSTANLLFLNQGLDKNGIPEFVESAEQTGLADKNYGTQAAFLDYDQDGDLDLFLLNNALEIYNRNSLVGQKHNGTGQSLDKLYRNDGMGTNGLPHFTEISKTAGILSEGWGLGVGVSDINLDGLPDIYAANDFQSNDQLYINRGDGTFSNEIARFFKHTCHNSMGMDIADLNNDQLPDLGVVDMLPNDNMRQKTMFPTTAYNKYYQALNLGYQPQFVRNVLQINNGNETFSDLGYLAGIAATDWSWSLLMADLDNDGQRDILITNGYRKDITDLDFVAYNQEKKMFGFDKSLSSELHEQLAAMKGIDKPNFVFQNQGDLQFKDMSKAWGLADPSYSNGTACADFDNDGDLDLVMNNINAEAFLYENTLNSPEKNSNYLRIKLIDPQTQGYGAKVWAYAGKDSWYAEYFPQKGYKSTQEAYIHLGLGKHQVLDSLRVTWPKGMTEVLPNVKARQVLNLDLKNAKLKRPLRTPAQTWNATDFFQEEKNLIVYEQEEKDFVDFNYQVLLPREHSELGPKMSTGDVDDNGTIDLLVGGAAGEPAVLFLQQKNGQFKKQLLPAKMQEDVGVLLFDADGDKDLDLYCVSGSTEFLRRQGAYQDRFYRNQGAGNYKLDTTALPLIEASGACVSATDYDRDGDLDLFVGGRIKPAEYPLVPQSFLLKNDGKGRFTDNTPATLMGIGMVTAAQWADLNGDTWPDLALVGEFMPIRIFLNNKGRLDAFDVPNLANTAGWYNSLQAVDLNADGRLDLVAGNLGLNSRYRASVKEPVRMYVNDYDKNGTWDPILCRYLDGKEYISPPRDNLAEQLPIIKRMIPTYAEFGSKTFLEIFPAKALEGVQVLEAKELRSIVLLNQGQGNWQVNPLPHPAQWSPIQAIQALDLNRDGHLDLICAGNDYSTEPLTGRYDASLGTVLLGNSKGQFTLWPNLQNGLALDGDLRDLALIPRAKGGYLLVAAQSNGPLQVYSWRME